MARDHNIEEQALKNADFLAWRIMNRKRQEHEANAHSILNVRPRLRREANEKPN